MSLLETLWTSKLSPQDAAAYDAFVPAARGGHYSQTRDWAKVIAAGKRFDPVYFLARRSREVVGAALLLRTRLALPLPFVLSERGPVCGDPDDLPDVLLALRRQARRHGVLRLSVMPYWMDGNKALVEDMLQRQGFIDRQSFAGRHARTLRLALDRLDANDPFASAALAKARREARRAERAGGSARTGTAADMAAFRRLHEDLLRAEGKPLPAAGWYDALAEYFLAGANRGAMFVCELASRIVSAIFITCHGGIATYILGASSGEALRFPKMILPMAMATVWAKQNGAAVFDFGGIPMIGDPDAKRASIADFKYSFSHEDVALVHEHVRWF